MNMNSQQTVSREEYRRLDNRVTSILQQRWPCRPSLTRCQTRFIPEPTTLPCRCTQQMAALLAAAISWRSSRPWTSAAPSAAPSPAAPSG